AAAPALALVGLAQHQVQQQATEDPADDAGQHAAVDHERHQVDRAEEDSGDHPVAEAEQAYSHSIVPGGLLVMSSTTRFTSRISLIIREAICSSRSYGSRAQSAVIASSLVTARIAITLPYVRSSPCTPTVRMSGSTQNDCHSSRYRPALRISSWRMKSAVRSVSRRSFVASPPTTRIARPGPGNGWRQTRRSGSPSSAPTARTPSLNSARSGSMSSNSRSSGRPPTLWGDLIVAAPVPPPDSMTSEYSVPWTGKRTPPSRAPT